MEVIKLLLRKQMLQPLKKIAIGKISIKYSYIEIIEFPLNEDAEVNPVHSLYRFL